MSENEWVVSVYVRTTDPGQVAKTAEVLGRAVAGLALEGVDSSLHVGPALEDETS